MDPGKFRVLPIWTNKKLQCSTRLQAEAASKRCSNAAVQRHGSGFENAIDIARLLASKQQWDNWVLHPNSAKRFVYDMLCVFLILYDVMVVPLQLLDPMDMTGIAIMFWVTRVFWTLDIFVLCLCGYVMPDGTVEIHPAKVAKHYLKRWFFFDFALVMADWLELALATGDSSRLWWHLGDSSSVFRAMRLLRLLRLLRVREVLVLFAELAQSERMIVFADIGKVTMCIVCFAHVVACFWYCIGIRHVHAQTWVLTYDYTSAPLSHRYWSALHWALVQFSGGSTEFAPQNIDERVYNVVISLLAFLMAAAFVSQITTSMTKAHLISNGKAQQLVALRRYLGENGISPALARRLQLSAEHALMEEQRALPEEKVDLLRLVSEPLRMDLHFEQYSSMLSVHPFLAQYMDECPTVMRKICHNAVSTLAVSDGDVIFSAGEFSSRPKMYFVCKGNLMYTAVGTDIAALKEGSWISEAVLWVHWLHQGHLTAKGNCRLYVIEAVRFQRISSLFDYTDQFDPCDYARHFVTSLNELQGDINDMFMPDVQWQPASQHTHGSKGFARGWTAKAITRSGTAGSSECGSRRRR
eukprot:TRINITY_DN14819_c0_g1_i3.p1 TRINITY_DN14819_c0_g1~~TRINITY_DN14819_c0_g1_i3.p1  ORF type:complete len:582 (+),score=113.64 TRINITY_DN14819_c0_g1_i3:852-2597(+)